MGYKERDKDRAFLDALLADLPAAPSEDDVAETMERWSESDFPADDDASDALLDALAAFIEPWIKASGDVLDEDSGETAVFPDQELPRIDDETWRREWREAIVRMRGLVP